MSALWQATFPAKIYDEGNQQWTDANAQSTEGFFGAAAVGTHVYFAPYVRAPPHRHSTQLRMCSVAAHVACMFRCCIVYASPK